MKISYSAKNNSSAPVECGLLGLLWSITCTYFRRNRTYSVDKWDMALVDFRNERAVNAPKESDVK